MPFQNTKVYSFDRQTLSTINEIGAIYGLARRNPSRSGWYTILYVGKATNLRKRLNDHLNDPPGRGITHFFAEAVATEAGRTQREAVLIGEFRPAYNTLLK